MERSVSPFRPLLRFVTRGSSASDGLIIGLSHSGSSDLIKPNHTYELVEIDGEVMLRDLGESCVAPSSTPAEEQTVPHLTWSRDVNSLLTDGGKWLFLTIAEAKAELKKLADRLAERDGA